MKSVILSIVGVVIFGLTSVAQNVFHKRYGSAYFDRAYRTIQTLDDNFLVVGQTKGFGSGGNAFIMKVDTEGTLLWVKDYSGINMDEIRDVIELSDGSLMMCGATFSYGEVNLDGFVMHTDSEGNVNWAKAYGNIYGQQFLRIAEDGDGGYYVAGYVQKPPPNSTQGTAIMRIDDLGNIQWVRWSPNWSAQGDWWPIDMAPIASGGVVVAGVGLDVWKFDQNGNQEWSERYRPSGNGGVTGLSLIENPAGEILLNFMLVDDNTVAQSGDNCILRLNQDGELVSHKCYGEIYIEWSRTIANTDDGGTIICGFSNSSGSGDFDASLTKLDSVGEVEWARAYGGAWRESSASAIQTSDKGFILTGQTWSEGTATDSSKVHLVKTDSIGNSSCNAVSWTPLVNDIIAPTETPNTMSNFTSLIVSEIDWSPNDRTFYESDLCSVLSIDRPAVTAELEVYPNPFSHSTT
ncbi:MAG: hypothetical protein WBG42_05125, partial [Cryomorphaceae bacterium]